MLVLLFSSFKGLEYILGLQPCVTPLQGIIFREKNVIEMGNLWDEFQHTLVVISFFTGSGKYNFQVLIPRSDNKIDSLAVAYILKKTQHLRKGNTH